MKRILLLMCFAVSLGATAIAQPVVSAKINKGYNPYYYGSQDTINATGHDTMYAAISGFRNSVGFNFSVFTNNGVNDTFSVNVYATKAATNLGPWTLLGTVKAYSPVDTMLDYNVSNGEGNQYTNYMFTFQCSNVMAGGRNAWWKPWVLLR